MNIHMHCAVPRVTTKPDLYCIRNAQVQDEKDLLTDAGFVFSALDRSCITQEDHKDLSRSQGYLAVECWHGAKGRRVIRSKTGEGLYIAKTHYKQALLYPHPQPQFLFLPTNRARRSFLYLWATRKQYAGYSAGARGQATSICHAVPLGGW